MRAERERTVRDRSERGGETQEREGAGESTKVGENKRGRGKGTERGRSPEEIEEFERKRKRKNKRERERTKRGESARKPREGKQERNERAKQFTQVELQTLVVQRPFFCPSTRIELMTSDPPVGLLAKMK